MSQKTGTKQKRKRRSVKTKNDKRRRGYVRLDKPTTILDISMKMKLQWALKERLCFC
jgi:hypothetical protein